MKKITATIAAVCSVLAASAQWTPLNSTTTNHLHDLDFIDPNYGVIVGDHGIILLTTDGGLTWSDINAGAINSDIYAVSLANTDTIFVSGFDVATTSATTYVTMNAGSSWSPVSATNVTNHRMDLELNGSDLFVTSDNLIVTPDFGAAFDTLEPGIAGTLSIDHLRFADSQTGHASGLISGFITYSAAFFRTENGGANWYPADPFSFPNADAFTTVCFIHPDTALMFTNHYNGFSPSAQNGMIILYDFNQTVLNGDTSFSFTSQVVNAATPAFMNDAYFSDRNNGYTAAGNGNIYITSNGGLNWTVDYTGSAVSPMRKMKFIGNVAYAIGENGTLVKNANITTGVETTINHTGLSLYPVPAESTLTIKTESASGNGQVRILDVAGKTIARFPVTSAVYVFDAAELSPGVYFLEYTETGKLPVIQNWVRR